MPARNLDDFESVLDAKMVRLPAPSRQAPSRQALAVLDVFLAVAQVGELRRVAADALKLARGSRGVQGKLGLHLQVRNELRVLHLQELAIAADLEFTVEPEAVDLHRDVAVLGDERRGLL